MSARPQEIAPTKIHTLTPRGAKGQQQGYVATASQTPSELLSSMIYTTTFEDMYSDYLSDNRRYVNGSV